MKTIDSVKFQMDFIEELRTHRPEAEIYFCYGYGIDDMRTNVNGVTLETDQSTGDRFWSLNRYRSGHLITATKYPADSVRINKCDTFGRSLVHSDSQELFIRAIEQSGLRDHSGNRVENEHGTLYRWNYLNWRSLDYSATPYQGEFRFNEPENCTFLPAGKPKLVDVVTKQPFDKMYQSQKIGKAARYILDCVGLTYDDQHIEKIVNYIKAENSPLEFLYSSQTGVDISEMYDTPAAENCGTLESSCMRGNGDFYMDLDQCPNVELVYTQNEDGELTSRALLWTTIRGTKILDRIYGTDAAIAAYKKLARANGWHHKQLQTYDSRRQFIAPDGEEKRATFIIEIDLFDCIENDRAPYLDTFCYYNPRKNQLSNDVDVINDGDGTIYELRSTGGCPDIY